MTPQWIVGELLSEEEAAKRVTPYDLNEATRFVTARRRSEFLSWRALARTALGTEVKLDYNTVGAPIVVNRPLFISVSHCSDRVAILLSNHPCGIDIERTDRNFTRASSRFLTPEEAAMSADPRWIGVVWCAKEALYKYSGRDGLDLLHDIRLHTADLITGQLAGRICGGDPVALAVHFTDTHTLVMTL